MRRTSTPKTYRGLNNDINGGMTLFGKIIRDAWVFGILPENETCEGWMVARLDAIHQQVNDEWDKYGCMISNLPDDLRARHKAIYDRAIVEARERGWDPEAATHDDD